MDSSTKKIGIIFCISYVGGVFIGVLEIAYISLFVNLIVEAYFSRMISEKIGFLIKMKKSGPCTFSNYSLTFTSVPSFALTSTSTSPLLFFSSLMIGFSDFLFINGKEKSIFFLSKYFFVHLLTFLWRNFEDSMDIAKSKTANGIGMVNRIFLAFTFKCIIGKPLLNNN